jgi:hypothetical protein
MFSRQAWQCRSLNPATKNWRSVMSKQKDSMRLRVMVCTLIFLFGISIGRDATLFAQVALPAVYLDEVLFTYDDELDHDLDGLKDNLEYQLAEHFKPLLVFDSAEGDRAPHEPVTLFQVRPEGCIGLGCGIPWRVVITFAFLFLRDGGYGPSSDCKDAHAGDTQDATFNLASHDGQSWSLTKIQNGKFSWDWPASFSPQWHEGTHPIIYMSAHKHHQYFSTAYDGKNSPYSSWGCNDDVNGRGVQVFPNLISPYPDQRPNNVGEGYTSLGEPAPDAHSPEYFINSLGAFGYPGENAWSTKYFVGKAARPVANLWVKSPFQFGEGFSTYVPLYTAVWRPDTSAEIQVYGWRYEDYRAKYDELWPQGWRLKLLDAYVLNGEVRYTAVWQPSTDGEIQLYGWTYDALRAEYDVLWGQGWRLKLLDAYVLNGEVRYVAVFQPSEEGEIQVYGWRYEDYRAKYDELWPQGWRLKLLTVAQP